MKRKLEAGVRVRSLFEEGGAFDHLVGVEGVVTAIEWVKGLPDAVMSVNLDDGRKMNFLEYQVEALDPIHLWEVNHEYYGADGREVEEFETWADFLDEWGDMDEDLNFLYRWDWTFTAPEDMKYLEEGEYSGDLMKLFYVLPCKDRLMSAYVKVDRSDEGVIREWLKPKAEYMTKMWAPLDL